MYSLILACEKKNKKKIVVSGRFTGSFRCGLQFLHLCSFFSNCQVCISDKTIKAQSIPMTDAHWLSSINRTIKVTDRYYHITGPSLTIERVSGHCKPYLKGFFQVSEVIQVQSQFKSHDKELVELLNNKISVKHKLTTS